MKILNSILIFLIAMIVFASSATAQEESTAKPIELPNFIIEGKEQLNIQSGYKQIPDRIDLLTKKELNLINPLEKQQSMLLPPKSFPSKIIDKKIYTGFLNGEFGRFTTPRFTGGWGFNISDYNFFLDGDYESSSGFIKNADYTNFNIKLSSDYIAPEKYWIFGGSRTKTLMDAKYRDFRLYALTTAPNRNSLSFDATIATDGSFEGFLFSTGAGYHRSGLDQGNVNISDNEFEGNLYIRKNIYDFEVGGGANIDYHAFRGISYHKMQAEGLFRFIDPNYTMSIKAGIQEVQNTDKVVRGSLLLSADFTLRSSKLFTFDAGIRNELQNNSFIRQYDFNPYISDTIDIDFAEMQTLHVCAVYHPVASFTVNTNAEYSVINRDPYFYSAPEGTFLLGYDKANKINFSLESEWSSSNNDKILLNIEYHLEQFANSSKSVPYISPLNLSAFYRKKLLNEVLSAEIALMFTGEKYADIDNTIKIPGYTNLKAKADVKLTDNLSAYAGIHNILNSEITIWEGYKERSMYFYAGVFWKF